jgi:apolipoprotein N-acyltransferase
MARANAPGSSDSLSFFARPSLALSVGEDLPAPALTRQGPPILSGRQAHSDRIAVERPTAEVMFHFMSPGLRLNTYSAIALCVAGAVLYFLSFLDLNLFALTWICFVPVLLAARGTSLRKAFWLGTIFGTVTNAGGFYWVVHLLDEFANLHVALAVVGFLLLCVYQGLLLALVLALVRRAQRDLSIAPVWSLAVAFPALELAYPLLFPSYIGNSQFHFIWITQFVDITGMAGLTALIGLVNGAVYEILDARLDARRIERLRLIVPVAAFALCGLYGIVRLPAIDAKTQAAEVLEVGLIQTNIGAGDKRENPEEFIARHREMSRQLVSEHPEVELIVWPESAYNRGLHKAERNVDFEITAGIGRPVLFGVITYTEVPGRPRSDAFNSVMIAAADGEVAGIYDKIELLAFGETVPLSGVFPVLGEWIGDGAWFTRGQSFRHLRFGDTAILPTVCFEDILPRLVRRLWRHDGPADVLVNVTNDSWYGDTHEPMIHLVLASFRSIETRRSLIRSTNTGISAIVDPAGRITHRTGQWTRETLVASVPLIKDGSTTIFMRVGNVFGWLCLALTGWGFYLTWRKRSV